jgi:hypothetical protein
MIVENYINGQVEISYTGTLEENKLEAIEIVKERFEETLKTRVFQSSLGFSVQNRRFGINNDLQNIDSLISVNVPFFMDADNIQRPVTLANLQTIKSEMIVDGLNLYQSKFNTIDAINEYETNAQIWAIIG